MRVLESDRLILRPFELSDAESMFRNWSSDPDVTKYLTWPAHDSVETTKAVIQNWIAEYKEGKLNWAIVLKGIDEPIGSIGVVEVNEEINEASLGYCIGKEWWGKGITADALSLVLKYLFEEKCFNRVSAIHDFCNPNSGKVMKKAGLRYEGTLKQAGKNNQGIIDVVVYGITKSMYNSTLNENRYFRKYPTYLSLLKDVRINPDYKLPIILGEEDDGNIFTADLKQISPLFIAGELGTARFECLYNIINPIIARTDSSKVKLLLLDHNYDVTIYNRKLNHLAKPVALNAEERASHMEWILSELHRRSDSFKEKGISNIDEYNDLIDISEYMPSIILVISDYHTFVDENYSNYLKMIHELCENGEKCGIYTVAVTRKVDDTYIPSEISKNIKGKMTFMLKSKSYAEEFLNTSLVNKDISFGKMVYRNEMETPVKLQVPFYTEDMDGFDYVFNKSDLGNLVNRNKEVSFNIPSRNYIIHIYPIKGLTEEMIEHKNHSALICCSSRITRLAKALFSDNFCAEYFEDSIDPGYENSIKPENADVICNFVCNLPAEITDIFICCDGGDSRSPAIAAAILKAQGRDESCIWENPYYTPNILVYYRLCRAFGCNVTWDQVVEKRIESNAAYRKAQQNGGENKYHRWEIIR